ncbi:uncharacterized protein [Montipora capricornis]|uniref:uncharacterized protein n=1 Tax=Montipora capricornis TaxID=246305 RepID=UPI0035F1B027
MAARYIGLFLLCSQLYYQAESWQCSNCDVPYKAKGCYEDHPARVLKTQIINERDPQSNVFNGHRINWFDWNNYMAAFACRCAKAVKEKGWKIFGLQFYGECWSDAPGSYDVNTFTPSTSCISNDYQPCGNNDRQCVGKQWTNFVFELGSDCDHGFERIGCFKDNRQDPRPLPDYIMTDRDRSLAIYSGQSIDWRNWDSYMPEFACRCAEIAKEKGHNTFGVQFYGECWSGSQSEVTYGKLGISTNCVDKCFEPCKPFKPFCAGANFANAVYRLSDVPCELSYESVGCFCESSTNRAFDIELLNQVNPVSDKFNGRILEPGENWPGEFTKFLCRCAREARRKGLSMFGVHEQGECWSARNANLRFDMHGSTPNKCFQNFTQACKGADDNCAGGVNSNFVYRVIDARIIGRSLDEEEKVPDASEEGAGLFDVPEEKASTAHKLRRTREQELIGRKPHFLN